MPTSIQYNNLQKRIQELDHLLPVLNPLGYTLEEQDNIRSYCLLCHAEIEYYLEEIIKAVVTKAIDDWKKDRNKVTTLIFHLAFSFRNSGDKSATSALPFELVHLSFTKLIGLLKSNNGVNNLNSLLKPIGYSIDETFATSLEAFGKRRGSIAHTSFQIDIALDRETERKAVEQIIMELIKFDEDLSKYGSLGISNRVEFNMQLGKLTLAERLLILFTGKPNFRYGAN